MPPKRVNRTKCVYCGTSYESKSLARHIKSCHRDKIVSHQCRACQAFMSDKNSLANHYAKCKKYKVYTETQNKNADKRREFYSNVQAQEEDMKKEGWILETFNDFKVQGLNYEHSNNIQGFNDDNSTRIAESCEEFLKNINRVRFILNYNCEFYSVDDSTENQKIEVKHFILDSKSYIVNNLAEFRGYLTNAIEDIVEKVGEVQQGNSKLMLKNIKAVTVSLSAYSRNKGDLNNNFLRNAGSFIDIQEILPKKKGITNIKNFDDKCLIWCIIAHFIRPINNANRVQHYTPYEDCVDIPDDIDLRNLTERDLAKIEKLNNIRINIIALKDDVDKLNIRDIKRQVFQARKQHEVQMTDMDESLYLQEESNDAIIFNEVEDEEKEYHEDELLDQVAENFYEEDQDDYNDLNFNRYSDDLFYPHRVSKYEIRPNAEFQLDFYGHEVPYGLDLTKREINLLLVSNYMNSHLILINNINIFFHREFVCTNCFCFRCNKTSKLAIEQHQRLCLSNDECKIVIPNKEKGEHFVVFRNIKNCHKLWGGVIYADFETTVTPIPFEPGNTEKRFELIPNSFGISYLSFNSENNFIGTYDDPDPKKVLLNFKQQLKYFAKITYKNCVDATFNKFDMRRLNEEQRQLLMNSDHCNICLTKYFVPDSSTTNDELAENEKNIKIIHHDHFTGGYFIF